MLEFLTRTQIQALADPYYAGRWEYMRVAAGLCRQIPGWGEWQPSDVLEIGPYRLPLVPGCDTLDNCDHGIPIAYRHDARQAPWPIADGRYRLLVSLQVWEHFDGYQPEAFAEARRVADWAVLSVPYLWPASHGDHGAISLDTLALWTGLEPECYALVSGAGGLDRIVLRYCFRDDEDPGRPKGGP